MKSLFSLLALTLTAASLNAAPFSWTPTTHDLNTATNWTPMTGPPGPADEANFDSGTSTLNPTAIALFSVDDINFLASASVYTFGFTNAPLQLNNVGITGGNTNATFNLVDTNAASMANQVLFTSGGPMTSGEAILNIMNTATAAGADTGVTRGNLTNAQIAVNPNFSMTDGGQINLLNSASDSSTTGGNNLASIGQDNLQFNSDFGAGDNVTIQCHNMATNTTSGGNTLAVISNPILAMEGNCVAGNNFTVIVNCTGDDSSNSAGNNQLANTSDNHLEANSFTVGNNATFTFLNSGTNTGTGAGSTIAMDDGAQLDVFNSFKAGDSLTVTATNMGTESGPNGGGNVVGYIAGDPQLGFFGTFEAGNNASITATNTASDSSISSGGQNTVGVVDEAQIIFNSTAQVGTNFTVTATNTVTNTGNSSTVGTVGGQIYFGDTLTMQDGGNLTAINNPGGVVNGYPGSQILFNNGFNQNGGRSNVTAVNHGLALPHGIDIKGNNGGGDVIVNLTNTDLYIEANSGSFTIGGLNGNSTSFVQSKPELIINTDSDVSAVFDGSIENFPSINSSLAKQGLGTQKLSGFNPYNGPTTIQQGTINLTGTLVGNMSINSPGTLIGTGIDFGFVLNDGTISPGENDIGTLTFGSFTNNSDGTYIVQLNGQGQSDLILVSGFANVQGGLVVASSIDGTFKLNSRYTILSAGSLNGNFASVNYVTSGFIKPRLTTDSNNIYLTLGTDFELAARTHNERQVAIQLDGIDNATPLQEQLLMELAFLSESQVTAALDSLSGSQYTNDFITSSFVNRQFIRRLYDPIRQLVTTVPCCNSNSCCDIASYCVPTPCGDAPFCGPFTYYPSSEIVTWIQGGGTMAELTRNRECHGFNYNGYEITAGIQKTFCNVLTLGLASSYENDDLHYKNHGGRATNQTWLAGLYGLYRPDCFYSLVDVAYGYGFNRVDRNIQVSTSSFHAHSKPRISQVTFYSEVGFDMPLCGLLFQPFIGIEGAGFWRNHFVESPAGGWELEVRHRVRATANTRLGFHLTAAFLQCVDLSLDLAWDASLNNRNNTCSNEFLQFGNMMDIYGVNLDSNSVDYALTLSVRPERGLRIYLEGSGEWWNRANLGTIQAGFTYAW